MPIVFVIIQLLNVGSCDPHKDKRARANQPAYVCRIDLNFARLNAVENNAMRSLTASNTTGQTLQGQPYRANPTAKLASRLQAEKGASILRLTKFKKRNSTRRNHERAFPWRNPLGGLQLCACRLGALRRANLAH